MADDTYNIRRELAKLVDALSDDEGDNQQLNVEMKLTANDVTGSLGVWGISH